MVSSSSSSDQEQVALSHWIDNAYETFEKSLLSASGRFVLWGSFADDEQLVKHYLKAKGKSGLTDQRRRLNKAENEYIDLVELAAYEANEYRKWARERDAQPILHESLISYCAAFENCLKALAIAFALASESKAIGLNRLIFVPGQDLTKARIGVNKAWKASASDDMPRVQIFFEQYIVNNNPDTSYYKFQKIETDVWEICAAAFKLRNSLLHNMARASEQIELKGKIFHPSWEIELSPQDLRAVKDAIERVLFPFSLWAQL